MSVRNIKTSKDGKSRKYLDARVSGMAFLFLAHILLPFASPFATGSIPYSSTSTGSTTGGAEEAAAIDNKPKGSLKKLLWYLNPSAGRKSGKWKNGEHEATLPSRLLFRYASPLVDVAAGRELEDTDSFHVPSTRKMEYAVQELSDIYNKCRKRARKNIEQQRLKGPDKVVASETVALLKALLLHQKRALLVAGVLRLVNTAVQAFPALLLARFLRLLESGDQQPPGKALLAALSLVTVLSVKMVIENQYFHNVVNCATQVRGSLAGLIFDKSLRLPSGSEGGSVSEDKKTKLGDGGILNLMQSDTSIIESASMQVHTIWDGPLQIVMYTTLLFRYLGPSVLWGIGVLVMVIPINSLTLGVLSRLRQFENDAKDARTRRTTEAVSNMKLLKLQAWEQNFADDIRTCRTEELNRHVKRGVVRALNQAISNAVPALVLVVTLTAYAKSGRPIVASTIFTAISLFNQLRFPLFFLPMLLDSLANGKNALRRISSYLSAEEIIPYIQAMPAVNGGGSISMEHGNFLWSSATASAHGNVEQSNAPALCEVNLAVKPGEIVAIVGNVGSGKTALIKGLLGELVPAPKALVDTFSYSSDDSDGDNHYALEKPVVVTCGNIAYCSQEAWLPKGTLRDAVIFGREYDENRYLAALRDAGLDDDVVDGFDGSNSKQAAAQGVLSHSTDVGEGGSSLSGGQRARVALARALYSGEDTKIFLLDDPLAALDAAVGATVFDRISKRLRSSNAATLIVTNDPNLPRRCDRVVLMGKQSPLSKCSAMIDVGTYDELLARGHDLRSFSGTEVAENIDDAENVEFDESSSLWGEKPMSSTHLMQGTLNSTNAGYIEISSRFGNCTVHTQHADPDCVECMKGLNDFSGEIPVTPDILDGEEIVVFRAERSGLDENTHLNSKPEDDEVGMVSAPRERDIISADEMMSKGAVPLSAYSTYFKSVRSPILIAGMVFAFFMSNAAQFYQQYVISKWTEVGRDSSIAAALGTQYLNSLGKAAGVVSIFLWLRSFLTMRVGVNASAFLHDKMLSSVFSAPMAFFDATPSGQLLSRFGKEMETVDGALPDGIGSVLFCFLQIGFSGAALAGVITPVMLIPLSVISIMYGKTMGRFRPAARDLKRGESRTRSPVYTHFGEALRGKEIIRSIPMASETWSTRHQDLTDKNLAVYYTVKALDRWLSVRLETLGNVVVFAAAVVSVYLTRLGKLQAGSAGWGLTQALAITGLLTWAVRTLTDLETNMMSMMRVKELTDLDSVECTTPSREIIESKRQIMPKEKQNAGDALKSLYGQPLQLSTTPTSDAALVASGWPWQGDIEFNNVSMRYNEESPLVLKNVSINVPAGTTLGVVGRTGSGKSSLLLALFRLVEAEKGGSIKIDNIDIRSVSLKTLRESLSIIPQDPVLFAGTLMYNLDATGKASSKDAWKALEAASPELAKKFKDEGSGLETYVSEGGKNLSSGQRQLICLARALLRKSKILVMDEATSSVDPKTDNQVQETIRKEFVGKGVTVLTVAHRLDTILGYDRIAVLGSGELLEYGSPAELLRNENGELKRLVLHDRRNKRKGKPPARQREKVTVN